MEKFSYEQDDTICALATPWGKGAIGIIRTSGENVFSCLEKIFSPSSKLKKAAGNTLVHGWMCDPADGNLLDEVMLAVYRSPHSYTGQDSVEIMCHGGLPGIRSILQLLRGNGFRDAGPGEFTMRAFLNGKMDLTRAEAVNEIINAKTRTAHQMAFSRLNGTIFRRIEQFKQQLLDLTARIELSLDYPEDETDPEATHIDSSVADSAIKGIEALLESYATGRLYRDGIRIALAGPTNAGKSSLFNLLVKEDRAIVSEEHGTTRDYLAELLTIRGLPVMLLDTAGLRYSEDRIESRGIERTKEHIRNSDLVLYVCDSTVPLDHKSLADAVSVAERMIRVWNKTDLPGGFCPEGFIPVSAETGQGLTDLEEAIIGMILDGSRQTEYGEVIDSDRQKILLEEAAFALTRVREGLDRNIALDMIAVDLQDAVRALGEITGEVSSRDILERMFSSFCVGK